MKNKTENKNQIISDNQEFIYFQELVNEKQNQKYNQDHLENQTNQGSDNKHTMTNWNEYKLGEIADVVGGGTPSTKVPQYYGGNIPWLTPKDLTNYTNRFIAQGERNITIEGLSNSSARMVPKNTILLTSSAPIGYMAIALRESLNNAKAGLLNGFL